MSIPKPWWNKPKTKIPGPNYDTSKATMEALGRLSDTGVYVAYHYVNHLRTGRVLRVLNATTLLVEGYGNHRIFELRLPYIQAIFDQDNKIQYRDSNKKNKCVTFLQKNLKYNVSMIPAPSEVLASRSNAGGGPSITFRAGSDTSLPLGADWATVYNSSLEKKYTDLLEEKLNWITRENQYKADIQTLQSRLDNTLDHNATLIAQIGVAETIWKQKTTDADRDLQLRIQEFTDQIANLNVQLQNLKQENDKIKIDNKTKTDRLSEAKQRFVELEDLADIKVHYFDTEAVFRKDGVTFANLKNVFRKYNLPSGAIDNYMAKTEKYNSDTVGILALTEIENFIDTNHPSMWYVYRDICRFKKAGSW